MYFDRNNRVKIELALAKGKKLYDKRHDLAKRDAAREMARALKESPNIKVMGFCGQRLFAKTLWFEYNEDVNQSPDWGRLVSTGSMMTGVAGRGAVASLNCSKHIKCR